jgi:hypothetical protein
MSPTSTLDIVKFSYEVSSCNVLLNFNYNGAPQWREAEAYRGPCIVTRSANPPLLEYSAWDIFTQIKIIIDHVKITDLFI